MNIDADSKYGGLYKYMTSGEYSRTCLLFGPISGEASALITCSSRDFT